MTVSATPTQGTAPKEFIAFNVGKQMFCIDIMTVREIRGWTPATSLPHSPNFVRGVINLRGTVLPVVDLAERLALPTTEPTARHAVIVVQNHGHLVGLLVEAVSNIMLIPPEDIQPTPEMASLACRSFIEGVVASGKEIINVLTPHNLLPNTVQVGV